MDGRHISRLVERFNEKEIGAFGEVYGILYEELFYYTSRLFDDTGADNRDVIHDTLLKLWQAPKNDFTSLEAIKAYLLLSIKNARRSLATHMKHVRQYSESHHDEQFVAEALETGILSTFHHILDMLPAESAEILSLFLEGWTAEEIAARLGKTRRTVYNRKSEAIARLKKKLPEKLFGMLLLFV